MKFLKQIFKRSKVYKKPLLTRNGLCIADNGMLCRVIRDRHFLDGVADFAPYGIHLVNTQEQKL
jgi:hypothetical protein